MMPMIHTISNTQYQNQFEQKVIKFSSLMREMNLPKPMLFRSPIRHYRMRAEFRIWHEKQDLFYVMFNPKTGERIKITTFEIASALINQAMPLLRNAVKDIFILRHKLFQIDFLSTLSGQLLITLLYHKPLETEWESAAWALREYLCSEGLDIRIVGRASKQKKPLPVDYVDEVLTIKGRSLTYRQVENSFTQPNAHINTSMIEWVHSMTKQSEGDLLELYCGNGNFCLAIAENFRSVFGTEIAKSSVNAALENIRRNNITNVNIVRLSSKEFTQALQGGRPFNRLKNVCLQHYDWQTVLVDPPRAGLDNETLQLISRFNKIIYISCNPLTLKENLKILTQTHHIIKSALFDQFPYTEHMECGIILQKKA